LIIFLVARCSRPYLANTLEIIAIASRAFAFYYMLQYLMATTVSKSISQRLCHAGYCGCARFYHRLCRT
ncbi:MAG: hypothetical protein ACYSOO_07610, partial [Planctomycetota bacterium]